MNGFRHFLGVLLSISLCQAAAAADWNIVLNGKAVHVNAERDWNEANWGLGFETELNPEDRWVRIVTANGFRDSQSLMSYMAGGGLKRRFWSGNGKWHVDLGLVGFFMHRENVNNNQIFPGVLPVLSFGTRQFAINATYLPGAVVDGVTRADRTDPAMRGVFFFQVKLDLALVTPRALRF